MSHVPEGLVFRLDRMGSEEGSDEKLEAMFQFVLSGMT